MKRITNILTKNVVTQVANEITYIITRNAWEVVALGIQSFKNNKSETCASEMRYGQSESTYKVLSLLLAIMLCLSSIPLGLAFAEDGEQRDITEEIEVNAIFESLQEDETWAATDELYQEGSLADATSVRLVLNWQLTEKSQEHIQSGDRFSFSFKNPYQEDELEATLANGEGEEIGTVELLDGGIGNATISLPEETHEGVRLTEGTIVIVPATDETDGGTKETGDSGAESESEESAPLEIPSSELLSQPFAQYTPRAPSGPTGNPNDAGSFGQISLVKFTQFANGNVGGIALDSSGRVWTFGHNDHGALGVGKTNGEQAYYGGLKRIPYFTDNNITIVEIGASYRTRYALSDTGKVYAWGDGRNGSMGNGTNATTNTAPIEVTGLPTVAHMFPSDSYDGFGSCMALAQDGTLWAWGYNYYGQLGTNDTSSKTTPVQVPLNVDFGDGTRKVVKVALGRSSSFLLDDKGDLWTSGGDSYGQQGNGSGTSNNRTFTLMDRSATGMARIVDVDASYSALQNISDRVVAADENGAVFEWGSTYGDGASAASRKDKQTPQQIVIDPAEIATAGYTPIPTSVTASEMVSNFIDQHGRPWSWGSGYYFGFGREGGYEDSNDQLVKSTEAKQLPKIIGDGDTQLYDTSAKLPVYVGGTKTASSLYGYGFNTLHPTIYDEKYMFKDASGVVLDTEGNRIKYATGTTVDGVSGLTRGMYYRVDDLGKITSPATTATPALNPTDALWIKLANQPVPYVTKMDMSLSAYAFIDSDGNLFKWGNDGSGAIAWGWDYDPKYDENGSLDRGLYDRYTYEVMYMRGAPTIDIVDLKAGLKDGVKVYKDPLTGDVTNTAEVKLHIPKTVASAELEADVHSNVNELKYVIVPYDEDDPNFVVDNTAMTYEQFMGIYNASDSSKKGDLISSPVLSGSTEQDLVYEVNVPENGRVLVWAVNERFVDGPGGSKEYVNINNVNAAFVADNVYTPILLNHKGVGIDPEANETELYAPTQDNVEKSNDDSADTGKAWDKQLYGLPLDGNGNVIGITKNSDGTIDDSKTAPPTYGYDTATIKSYEAVGDIGLPSGIKPYWKFKQYLDAGNTIVQPQTASKKLNDDSLLQSNSTHMFYYEQDPDYWTPIDGEKTWEDHNDRFGFRPDSISLTLKQYERDTATGVKGSFIKDVETKAVTPDLQGKWKFAFGSQKSYEYTYEIEETPIPVYSTEISYPNLVIGGTTNENLSGVSIVNTLALKPVKFNKVDSSKSPISTDIATFTLTNATAGGKVFDENGLENNSIVLSTSSSNPYIVMPVQKPGVYHLAETKAPAGYNLLTKEIVVTVDATGSVSAVLGSIPLEEAQLSGTETEQYAKAFDVINKTASELPKAGGIGTLVLTVISTVILMLATYLLRKRSKAKTTAI